VIHLFKYNDSSKYVSIPDRIVAVDGRVYELDEKVGSGGNGVVYKCYDRISGDAVAIKFLLNKSREGLKRFALELKLLKEMRHRQSLQFINHGKVAGTEIAHCRQTRAVDIHFAVTELAESNLAEYLQKNKSVRFEEYIAQFTGLSEALGELHALAIHRDIKPENVLISGERWILSDLGLCKSKRAAPEITGERQVPGPRYWPSPESINIQLGCADVVREQSDVFQLCCIFWFVVTGRNPVGSICKEDWTGPEMLFPVIFEGLSHNSNKRPSDGNALALKLRQAVET